MRTGLFRSVALGLIVIGIQGREARAWIYPEHRNIAGAAVAGLRPEEKAALERLWSVARKGYENRLCESPWAGDQGHPGLDDLLGGLATTRPARQSWKRPSARRR